MAKDTIANANEISDAIAAAAANRKPNPSQVVYLLTQTELNNIFANCQSLVGTDAGATAENIMTVLDNLTRMDA